MYLINFHNFARFINLEIRILKPYSFSYRTYLKNVKGAEIRYVQVRYTPVFVQFL